MKLKKIASLALAGIMAVSMLAGCKSNPTDPENPTNPTTPATGIAAAMNDGQSATNAVKVDFSSNASVEAAMIKVLKGLGDSSKSESAKDFTDALQKQTGITAADNEDMVVLTTKDVAKNYSLVDPDGVDGKSITRMWAYYVTGASTEEAAQRIAIAKIDSFISELPDTTFVSGHTADGDKYADYSYTGTVDMVSYENTDGTTSYFVAYTITRTAKVNTFEN